MALAAARKFIRDLRVIDGGQALVRPSTASTEHDRMRSKLIALGKSKGFVTYDEINDHMPDDVVTTEQIDSWLMSLADEDIAIVDSGLGAIDESGDETERLVGEPPDVGEPDPGLTPYVEAHLRLDPDSYREWTGRLRDQPDDRDD